MKNGMKLNAPMLRIVLIIALFAILLAGGGGFYYLQHILKGYAQDTSTLNSQALASDQNIEALQKVQAYLAAHQDDIARAKKVVADTKQYKYQNEIVDDISKFASDSGVTVTAYSFSSSDDSTGSTSSTTPTTPQGTAPATPDPAASAAGGLKSIHATITIKSPLNYNSLLKFISHIEHNITKMQIASVTLSRAENSKSQVSSNDFDIEVYVR